MSGVNSSLHLPYSFYLLFRGRWLVPSDYPKGLGVFGTVARTRNFRGRAPFYKLDPGLPRRAQVNLPRAAVGWRK